MDAISHTFERTTEIVDTTDMFDAAIQSLSRQDEYIPVQQCKFLNQFIEGVISVHQAFVPFLPDIDDVKSLLPLKRDISTLPSFSQIEGKDFTPEQKEEKENGGESGKISNLKSRQNWNGF